MISRFISEHWALQGAVPVLLDAAVKGAVLVLLAAAAAYVLRKRSAASRHAVWTAAVIGHLTILALMLIMPAWTIPVLPAAPWMANDAIVSGTSSSISAAANEGADRAAAVPDAGDEKVSTSPAPTTGVSVPIAPAGSATTAAAAAPASTRPQPIALLAALWLIGAMIVLIRLAIGTWRVNQLAREGSRVEDGVWLSLTQRLANRLGVSRPLTLLRGERLAVPVTWGIVYPAVLLPQDADEWTEERRRFVLVHEMAHVKRFDALTQLLAQLAAAVFWFDPLVWVAVHRMRVEREHACDDYVLRDGTVPSLYAGELLEMVRSIGTPTHDRAAPAFAALAMARRSEFEGRMLSILDPRLDRKTLNTRGTLMTAVIVALLTIPLAALRPYQQPATPKDELPASFKVSITEDPQSSAAAGSISTSVVPGPVATSAGAYWPSASMIQSEAKAPNRPSSTQGTQVRWSCEAYPVGTVLAGTSTHVSEHIEANDQKFDFLLSEPGSCTEAVLIGKAVFSPDETRLAQLAPGGFARFRQRTRVADRAVSMVPVGDGSLSYTATLNGQTVPFDSGMQAWLSELLPQVLREAGMNVRDRVARLRAQGGVPAVLREIAQIHSSSSKRMHYEELIKHGPLLSASDVEKIAAQVGRDLTSSGDLSAVLQMLPRSAIESPGARAAIGDALARIPSSGDKANTLQILAPNADRELLLVLAKAAESLPSSGDKANFLIATAAEYLTPGDQALRNAFFRATSTLQSSGDMANVLMMAMPYGHAHSEVTLDVLGGSNALRSSGDAANVLLSLVSQRLLQPQTTRATHAAIQRTLTMGSSGDRANVLISIGQANLLSNAELRDAFIKAAMSLPTEGDRQNVLAAVAKR
jgi:beta-lactamase regulating signal transducer with metallopeptidase domain